MILYHLKNLNKIAKIFNGELVMAWTGLQGKQLGAVLGQYKNLYSSNFETWSAQEVERHFKNWFDSEGKDVIS